MKLWDLSLPDVLDEWDRIDKRGKLVKTGTHRTIVDRIRERSSPKTKFKRGK